MSTQAMGFGMAALAAIVLIVWLLRNNAGGANHLDTVIVIDSAAEHDHVVEFTDHPHPFASDGHDHDDRYALCSELEEVRATMDDLGAELNALGNRYETHSHAQPAPAEQVVRHVYANPFNWIAAIIAGLGTLIVFGIVLGLLNSSTITLIFGKGGGHVKVDHELSHSFWY
jgi:hypothetical protein